MGAVTGTIIKNKILEDVALGRDINEVKTLMVYTDATADDGDTIEVDLSDYNGSTLLGAFGLQHSTANSVVVVENPTTAVSGTVVTLTITGSTDNKVRAYKLFFS